MPGGGWLEQKFLTHVPRFGAVDFFCGAGGTTRGLIDAGAYVIAGVDNDLRCESTYISNNKNTRGDKAFPLFLAEDVFAGSEGVSDLDVHLSAVVDGFRSSYPSTPLLVAITAPCQPFTKIAKKEMTELRRTNRERDKNLLLESLRFVELLKPELVFAENVQGITHEKYGGVWAEFVAALEKFDYVTGFRVVCASDFGLPQFRKRTILLAVKRSLVAPERLADLLGSRIIVPQRNAKASRITVKEAIGHFPPIGPGEAHPTIPNHRTRGLSSINQERLKAVAPGESNVAMNSDGSRLAVPCHTKLNGRMGSACFTDVYTRMHPDRPSPTITTKCHSISNGRFGHYDINQIRGISLREAATLQGFPETYQFFPLNQLEPASRMIGNAVPPPLAEYFANYLVESIEPGAMEEHQGNQKPRRKQSEQRRNA